MGGYSSYICGEPFDLGGDLEFSAAHRVRSPLRCAEVRALLDSGAFTDPPERRLSPAAALGRMLRWEADCRRKSGLPGWKAEAVVSYDRLIDETWVAGRKIKRRWSIAAAEAAVGETVAAARYLALHRRLLAPRTLVLSCQGVDAIQYAECAAAVLRVATERDWIGLGGWCILGRNQTWLPEFWRTIRLVLPQVAARGVRHVHIFGVTWLRALGGLLWVADECGLTVSTDSAKPVLDSTMPNPAKAGLRVVGDWRANVRWWIDACDRLRESEWYREPPRTTPMRQLSLGGL